MKAAYEYYREKGEKIMWFKILWRSCLLPKLSLLVWKICRKRMLTASRLDRRGMMIENVCTNCIHGAPEDENRIFLFCNHVSNIWTWISQLIGEDLTTFSDVKDLVKWAAKLKKEKSVLSSNFCSNHLRSLGAWEMQK